MLSRESTDAVTKSWSDSLEGDRSCLLRQYFPFVLGWEDIMIGLFSADRLRDSMAFVT